MDRYDNEHIEMMMNTLESQNQKFPWSKSVTAQQWTAWGVNFKCYCFEHSI